MNLLKYVSLLTSSTQLIEYLFGVVILVFSAVSNLIASWQKQLFSEGKKRLWWSDCMPPVQHQTAHRVNNSLLNTVEHLAIKEPDIKLVENKNRPKMGVSYYWTWQPPETLLYMNANDMSSVCLTNCVVKMSVLFITFPMSLCGQQNVSSFSTKSLIESTCSHVKPEHLIIIASFFF